MNFWASKLGPGQAAPPPVKATAPASAPWWAYPSTPGQEAPQPVEEPVQELPPALKAKSARSAETCPECGSGNYFKPDGFRNAASRCFECGYPVQHSTSGMAATSSDGAPPTPARQISTGNNYHPETIVGRIN